MEIMIESIGKLVNEFSKLPGVGKKTAQRYAYKVIDMSESEAREFADAILGVKRKVRYCSVCGNFTEDEVCGIVYNGNAYYFVKNLQGDVIYITNANGEIVAKYSYDAWGKPTTVFDTSGKNIAYYNPFRYRCYYYDVETGLYYLLWR